MKVKNISGKVISIGATVLLPGEEKEITAKGYKNNDSIDFLCKFNMLEVVAEKAEKADKKTAKTGDK